MNCRASNSISRLCSLASSSLLTLDILQSKMSPDIVKHPLGPKLPLIENHSEAFTNHQRRANEDLEMLFTTPTLFFKTSSANACDVAGKWCKPPKMVQIKRF